MSGDQYWQTVGQWQEFFEGSAATRDSGATPNSAGGRRPVRWNDVLGDGDAMHEMRP